MSHRGGPPRPAAPPQQPLRATVSYQLLSRTRPQLRDVQPGQSQSTAAKIRPHQLSSSRRWTMSPDAFTESYLQGQWLKDPEGQSARYHKDKCTQTPDSWPDRSRSRGGGSSHRRSASLGGADHKQEPLQCSKPAASEERDRDCHWEDPQEGCSWGTTQPIPIPRPALSTLSPQLCSSVEGLNQELEGMFISPTPDPQHRLLEVPDGHRAPIPPQSSSNGSQCDLATFSLASAPSSPCCSPNDISTPKPQSVDPSQDQHPGSVDSAEVGFQFPFSLQSDSELPPSEPNSSPEPNTSCCFHRDPPEGCEKVTALEDLKSPQQPKSPPVSSCPDPNKVNFTPHGGSAFCPVRLL
ncbi:protein FAM117A-like isoform X2 [Salarias fasciatus]|uniref:protein FAM117A-like isoform X2 n=1 Tax=Salarias fasciatus TaxID=181472 RepID=UPI001176BC7C|nr:protein FAM117A-like isoform X2 [Salarias fasciatus]